LKKFYISQTNPAAGAAMPPAGDGWEKLPAAFAQANTAENSDEKWQIIRAILPMSTSLGHGAYAPFALILEKISPPDASLAEIAAVYKIFKAAGMSIPSNWTKTLEQMQEQDIDPNAYSALLVGTYAEKSDGSLSPAQRARIDEALKGSSKETQEFLSIIIENIDKKAANANNGINAYENELSLTFGADYVMPSVRVWDRITIASQMKAAGETVLLGSSLMSDRALQSTYPGLLRDVLHSFDEVGLTNISGELASAASIGSVQ
jgi:hypothetical protein